MQTRLTVKSVAGHCGAGHQAGDSYLTDGTTIQAEKGGGICLYALAGMFPYLTAYCRETPQSDWINSLTQLACPDADNQVIFSVERIGS